MHCTVLNCNRDATDRLMRNTEAGSYVIAMVCSHHLRRIESEPDHWSLNQKLNASPVLVRDMNFV